MPLAETDTAATDVPHTVAIRAVTNEHSASATVTVTVAGTGTGITKNTVSGTPVATAKLASAFLGTLGVNTHTSWWTAGPPYGLQAGGPNTAGVLAELAYLGINKIRDTLDQSWSLPEYQQLAAAGIKFNFYIGEGGGSASMASQLSYIAALAPSVIYIEGPNETDLGPITYNGKTGPAATFGLQADLYKAVHDTPALQGIPVIESSIGNVPGNGTAFGGLGNADFGNMHSYFFDFSAQIATQLQQWIAGESKIAPALPLITTESGWQTPYDPAIWASVDTTTQAKLTLDVLFDDFNAGIKQTFIYSLADIGFDGDHFGLFQSDGTAKPVATAIHNLTTILADTSGGTPFINPSKISLSGMPSTGQSTLLQKSDGTSYLAIWNEASIWSFSWDFAKNIGSGHPISVNSVPIAVNLGGKHQTVSIYDPLQGTSPVQVLHNVSSFKAFVPDHPVIIAISSH